MMLTKFSEELKETRLKSGITLQQISARTRIDMKFLESIENGDFTFLPDTYVKAFIRDYARMIGLDEAVTLNKFEAAKKGKRLEEEAAENVQVPVPEKTPPKTEEKAEVRQPWKAQEIKKERWGSSDTEETAPLLDKRKLFFIGLLAGGALFIFGIIYLLFMRSSSEIVVVEKPIDEVIQKTRSRFVEEEAEDTSVAEETVPSDSISIVILAKDTSWIQIIIDDSRVEEFILFPNSQKGLKAQNNYKITIGNSSAISFLFNDQPLAFTGRPGGVTYVQIDNSGLQYLRQPPALTQTQE